MKNQALFSSKDKSKKLKCRLLQFLFGALMVKYINATKTIRFTESTKESIKPINIKIIRKTLNIYFLRFSVFYVRVSFNIASNIPIKDKATDTAIINQEEPNLAQLN